MMADEGQDCDHPVTFDTLEHTWCRICGRKVD